MCPVVTHAEIQCFIQAYLDAYKKLSFNLSENNKHFLLPKFLTEKCEIIISISKAKGVSIRFIVNQKKDSIQFQDTMKPIEDEVLPRLLEKGNVFFVLDGERQVLENINLITKEYYDKNREIIEKLTRSSNFIMDKPEKFFDIVSGDIKLINCTLAFSEGKMTMTD